MNRHAVVFLSRCVVLEPEVEAAFNRRNNDEAIIISREETKLCTDQSRSNRALRLLLLLRLLLYSAS
jgi:hypothetical protein